MKGSSNIRKLNGVLFCAELGTKPFQLASLTQENAVDLYNVDRVPKTSNDGRRKTYTSRQKHESLSLHGIFSPHWLPFVRCFVERRLKSNARTAVTKHNPKTGNCIISHAKDTTALKPNMFVNGNFKIWRREERKQCTECTYLGTKIDHLEDNNRNKTQN